LEELFGSEKKRGGDQKVLKSRTEMTQTWPDIFSIFGRGGLEDVPIQ